jgi:hypothetical protein
MTNGPALSAGVVPDVVMGTCELPAEPVPLEEPPLPLLPPLPLAPPPVPVEPEPPAPDAEPPCPVPVGLPVEPPPPEPLESPMRPVHPHAPRARIDRNNNERDRDFDGFIVTPRWLFSLFGRRITNLNP